MKDWRLSQMIFLVFLGLLAACSGTPALIPGSNQASPALTDLPVSATDRPPAETLEEVTPSPPAGAGFQPIEVTYITPSQQEGPFYPPEKPADHDNDLVQLEGASGLPAGQILEFGGRVYDVDGYPVEGATVEIWQTDSNGVYFHPNDPGRSNRDHNFQGYGEAQTAADGSYHFRTILPGLYEPRPRHIHVKVRLGEQELLTTQFYFAGEIDLQGDQAAMLIAAQPGRDVQGNLILVGERDIVLGITLTEGGG